MDEQEVHLKVKDMTVFESRFTRLELGQENTDHKLEELKESTRRIERHLECIATAEDVRSAIAESKTTAVSIATVSAITEADKKFLLKSECGAICRSPAPGSFGAMAGRIFAWIGAGAIVSGLGASVYFLLKHWDMISPMVPK